MLDFIHQHKFLIRKIIGYILIPVTMCLWFIHYDVFTDNFTGLLNDTNLFPFLHIYCMVVLLWIDYIWIDQRNIYTIGFEAFAVFTALVPYNMESGFLQSLHLFFAYGAFLLFQKVLLSKLFYDQKRFSIYIGMCLLCFLLTATFSSIIGLTELIYAITVSILIT